MMNDAGSKLLNNSKPGINLRLISLLLTLFAVVVGATLVSRHQSSERGGMLTFALPGGFEVSTQTGEADFGDLLNARVDDVETQALVKDMFKLYKLDDALLDEIRKQDYHSDFSRKLREMRDRMVGPFNSPDVEIELSFSDQITDTRAQVCPDSIFLNQSVNISTADGKNMRSIENANELLIDDCPAANREFEKVVVASEFGSRLLQTDKPPASINAIAKPLSVRFVSSRHNRN